MPVARIACFSAATSASSTRRAVERRDRVLPEQIVLERHFRAEVAVLRPHVAVGQLVPRLGEGLGEGVEVVEEFLADLAVVRVDLQRDVRGHHHQRVHLPGDVRVRGLGRVRDRSGSTAARRPGSSSAPIRT